jgi:molybdenum cofactor cytidylyltransferase
MSLPKTGMVLLAAGASTRMGRCKFLLQTPNGISLLEQELLQSLPFQFEKTVIVTNAENYNQVEELRHRTGIKKVNIILNPKPELERLHSLKLGLKLLKNCDYVFMHNADNPFLNPLVIEQLIANRQFADVIIPIFFNKGGHPILLSKHACRIISTAPESSRIDIEIKKLKTFRISVNDKSILTDLDTPDDYRIYLTNN